MSDPDEVTRWIDQMKSGDQEAFDRIWATYSQQVLRLARQKLTGVNRRHADEEDVAIDAFDSLWRRANDGGFEDLSNRETLWKLLYTITIRKVYRHIKLETAAKRGSGDNRGESVFVSMSDAINNTGIDGVEGELLSPSVLAEARESVVRLLTALDDQLQAIAIFKLEGLTNNEIADRLQISSRAVVRKLALIRDIWNNQRDCDESDLLD